MKACQEGHKDIVKLLLDHSDPRVELNAGDNGGYTAFMWACYYGHKEVIPE